MLKNLFKEYVSRQECMYNESSLVFTYLIGSILAAIACCIIGVLLLHANHTRKTWASTIYKPLGFFFIGMSLTKVMDIVCVWYNLAWVLAIIKMMVGALA